jgi:hypothetical protein
VTRLLFSLSFFMLLFMGGAHAEQVGEGSTARATAKPVHKNLDQGEYGDGFVEEAGLHKSMSDAVRSAARGHSWRNTQLILMGMKNIRCRKGGINAKTAAIPALAEEGYCNQKGASKRADQYPNGTVWVYSNGRHGNTVVKIGNGKFFDNRLMSSPPAAHGTLTAIMVPGCGKKAKKCETVNLDELAALQKASDDVKAKHAEAMERRTPEAEAEAQADTVTTPSPERLSAEESCGYANAFRAPDAFNECVEEKLSK